MSSATRRTRTLLDLSEWTVESQVFYVNAFETPKLKYFDTSLGVPCGEDQHLSNPHNIFPIVLKNAIRNVFCGRANDETLKNWATPLEPHTKLNQKLIS